MCGLLSNQQAAGVHDMKGAGHGSRKPSLSMGVDAQKLMNSGLTGESGPM